jgi:hypothetical protein
MNTGIKLIIKELDKKPRLLYYMYYIVYFVEFEYFIT